MHSITDNDLFQRLVFDNPWWEFTDQTEIRFKHPPTRVFFDKFLDRITSLEPEEPMVLTGPLRAGKTVMIRQAIARLIEQGVSPRSVMYVSLSNPGYAATSLATIFELFCRRYKHRPDARIYVFFDEAVYFKTWAEDLVSIARARPFARIIASASAGAAPLASGERDPETGLRHFVLPPLTFLEFLRFRGTEEKLFGKGAAREGGRVVYEEKYLGALNQEFARFVNFGGFPEGIMAKAEGAPAPTFIRDNLADRVLHKDLPGLRGIADSQELNKLFTLLAFNTAREVSMDELAKQTGIAKNTLRKYLDYLESAFLIRRVMRVDRDAKFFQRAVAFKIYLVTPCLYAALFGPEVPNTDAFARLAETALVAQWIGLGESADLAYASWRGGHVDLIAFDQATGKPDLAYEMDWTDAYGKPGKGPKHLTDFVRSNCPGASTMILTQRLASPATMKGVDLNLVPTALYAYWLARGRSIHPAHAKRGPGVFGKYGAFGNLVE